MMPQASNWTRACEVGDLPRWNAAALCPRRTEEVCTAWPVEAPVTINSSSFDQMALDEDVCDGAEPVL